MIRFPPKKILVPFDFTEASLDAWGQAKDMAARFGGEVEAVYVEDLLPGDAWEPLQARVTPGLRKQIVSHLRTRLGAQAKIHVLEGDPALSILSLIRRLKPDLVAMGTTGRRGLSRLWAGSVAEAVVHSSPAPVMTLHARATKIDGVLVPVNFTDYSEYGLAYAAAAAAAMKLPLTVLHVVSDPARCPNPKFRLNTLVARLPEEVRKNLDLSVLVKAGAPVETILTTAGVHSLIALVAHRKSLLQDWVLGTTAERVLRHSRGPVLAVPSPNRPFQWKRWLPAAEAVSGAAKG